MKTKFIMMGCEAIGRTVQSRLEAMAIDAEVIVIDNAKEMGIPTNPEPLSYELSMPTREYSPPLTRKERRANARKKKK